MASTSLTIALFAILVSYVSSLTCLRCTNITGDNPQVSCLNPVIQTCGAGQDSCEIIEMKVENVFGDVYNMVRNCGVRAMCGQRCKQINETKVQGKMLECRIHCCQGDRCNYQFPVPTVAPTTINVTASVTPNKENATSLPVTPNKENATTILVTTATGVSPTIQVVSGIMYLMMLILGNMLVNEMMM